MKPGKGPYIVVVGNIGKVYEGTNYGLACESFGAYKRQSHKGIGRAAGEQVTLFNADGEIIFEYLGADGD